MANRIKGITIEIGGDTTKLDKALAGTNKQLSTTQRELKAVEKALKMDPGNTELLAQKQRLLGDAASATSEKLQVLRQAAQTADAALARGQDYEAKYAPLKEEIDQVSASLKGLLANQKNMESAFSSGTISAASYDQFQEKVEATQKRLEALRAAQKNLEQEFAGAKLNQSQYDALQRELVETEQAAKDAEKAVDDFSATAQKVGAAASGIADGAGKVREATQGLSTAAAGVLAAAVATVPATEELRNSMATLQTNAEAMGVSFTAAKTAMQDFNVVSGELDSSLEATSNLLQAGFTESNLQAAVENLAGAYLRFPDTLKIESLADSLQETLATGSATGQFGELLDRLGIGAENFSAQLAQIPDAADRINLALSALDHEGLNDTYQAWLRNNQALAESRNASYEFQQSMAELAETVQPFLTDMVEMGTGLLNWFNSLPEGVKTATGVILLFIAAISPLAGLIASVATVASMAGVAMTSWLPIILAVTAALAALAAIIGMVTSSGNTGNASSSRSIGGFSGRTLSVVPEDVPHLASGGVARRNNPFLAVVGDNTQEDEVISPYSTIKSAAAQGVLESGLLTAQRTTQNATMVLDGRIFARLIVPYVREELIRTGVKLSK